MATANDTKTATPSAPPVEQSPVTGGSYVRQPDGSLEQKQVAKPAAPKLNTHPADAPAAREE